MTRPIAFVLAALIAAASAADDDVLRDMCAACHGPDGKSEGLIPSLADLEPAYVASQLIAFRSGARKGTVMNLIAAGLSDEDIATFRTADTSSGAVK
jgi:sulfide dehydrogenase cytochrome subunit